MSDIFLCYARDDTPRAEALVRALEARGWSVWWDRLLRQGVDFVEVTFEELSSAGCVLVLWSEASVDSNWVKEEAREGARLGSLIPARIDDVMPPLGFRRIRTADLLGWRGSEIAPEFQRLVESIEARLGARERRLSERVRASTRRPPKARKGRSFGRAALDGAGRLAGSVIGAAGAVVGGLAGATGALVKGIGSRLRGISERRKEAAPSQDENVQLTVRYPTITAPATRHVLLAYVHLPADLEAIQTDAAEQLGEAEPGFAASREQSDRALAIGAEVTIVPELPQTEFEPRSASFTWRGSWERLEFVFRYLPEDERGRAESLEGRVAFYVGPILIGDIEIRLATTAEPAARAAEAETTSDPYQAVFVSYSHDDTAIVEQLEKAYRVLGLAYLRDVNVLRSGEKWSPALLEKIDEADIFQLCWSHAAKASEYVEKEWRHALKKQAPAFIRPIYWEEPIPDPPVELADLHFAFYSA